VTVSHACATPVTSPDESAGRNVPGLLEVLSRVPDHRKRRGRRYLLTFVLAVAVACALAGARNFREAGDHAADLPQDVLARLGGTPHPLRRRIIAPSETRIRTLIQATGADLLDDLIGGWLRELADAGRLDGLLTAIAVDGKWLRGVLDGQVKLFAAMLQQQKVVIGQVRVPDDTTESTQVKALLDSVDLRDAVVTADAAHSGAETARYIAGKEEDGGRESDYFLYVKGNTPTLQRACFDVIQASGQGRAPDWTELDRSHGRTVRRSIWVADAKDLDFPQVTRVARIRRDRYDADGCLVSKEIVHAVTSLTGKKAGAEALAGIARGQWGIESVHWVRDTAWDEDASTGYRGNGAQVMATLRNLAVSLLYLAGVKEVTRTLQAIARDRNRLLDYLPL
jgi:predicted transposase YbfD/YdcC